MLSCFGGHRSRHGKGHKHRAKHAAYSEANTSSTASELSAAAAVAAVHHSGGLQNGGMQNGGGGPASGHARSASAASVPQPTTPRQAQRRLSPVGGNPHPGENVAARQECGLTVAVPSFDSETSSMEAAWVAGYDGRHNTCGGGAGNGVGSMSMSSASFTSARSSFSSTVSSAQSDGDFSFRPHLNCHTGKSGISLSWQLPALASIFVSMMLTHGSGEDNHYIKTVQHHRCATPDTSQAFLSTRVEIEYASQFY